MKKLNAALLTIAGLFSLPAASQNNPIQESDACAANLNADPRFRAISGKLSFDLTTPPTLEALANKTKASAKEKPLLSAYAAEREKCLDIANEVRQKNLPPEALALINTYRTDMQGILADLYSGSITYGAAVKARHSIASIFRQNFDALARRYKAQDEAAAQQRNAELARQEAQRVDAEARRKYEQSVLEQQAEQLRIAKAQAQRQKEEDLNRSISNFIEATRPQMPQPRLGMRCTTNTYGNQATTNCN